MSRLDYYSPAGQELSFLTGSGVPIRLLEISGMEGVKASPLALKSPGQPGESALDLLIPSRTLVATGILQARTNDALWQLRRTVQSILVEQPVRPGATLQLGRLQLTRDNQSAVELLCIPTSISMPRPAGTAAFCGIDVEFYAPYPYWQDAYDSILNFNAAGGWYWGGGSDVQFPLAMATNNITQDVQNTGDVDAPLQITITGDCTNPAFTNVTTGETIALTGHLIAGDYIVIDTTYGNKSVTLYHLGVASNAMSWVNLATTTFWSLRPGIQTVSFYATPNPSGYSSATFRRRYSGV